MKSPAMDVFHPNVAEEKLGGVAPSAARAVEANIVVKVMIARASMGCSPSCAHRTALGPRCPAGKGRAFRSKRTVRPLYCACPCEQSFARTTVAFERIHPTT